MSSIVLRRLFSHKIPPQSHLRQFSARSAARRELRKPSPPWLLLPSSFISGGRDMVYNFYSPIKDKVVSFNNKGGKQETDLMRHDDIALVGSSHGWLALCNTRNRDLFLFNPLSARRIDLPPYAGKLFVDGWSSPAKIILSSSPDDDDCRALMILGGTRGAAFCRPGRCKEWSPLAPWSHDSENLKLYVDFVYSAARKQFLGLALANPIFDKPLELEGWDITEPVRPERIRLDRLGKRGDEESHHLFLGSSSLVAGEQPDQLFLVRQDFDYINREMIKVRVYRIENAGMELCSSLDDLVMFVGMHQSSLAVKASRFPQLKPNSIYFIIPQLIDGQVKQCVGMFDYQNKTCSPVYYSSLHHDDPTPNCWFTPTLD